MRKITFSIFLTLTILLISTQKNLAQSENLVKIFGNAVSYPAANASLSNHLGEIKPILQGQFHYAPQTLNYRYYTPLFSGVFPSGYVETGIQFFDAQLNPIPFKGHRLYTLPTYELFPYILHSIIKQHNFIQGNSVFNVLFFRTIDLSAANLDASNLQVFITEYDINTQSLIRNRTLQLPNYVTNILDIEQIDNRLLFLAYNDPNINIQVENSSYLGVLQLPLGSNTNFKAYNLKKQGLTNLSTLNGTPIVVGQSIENSTLDRIHVSKINISADLATANLTRLHDFLVPPITTVQAPTRRFRNKIKEVFQTQQSTVSIYTTQFEGGSIPNPRLIEVFDCQIGLNTSSRMFSEANKRIELLDINSFDPISSSHPIVEKEMFVYRNHTNTTQKDFAFRSSIIDTQVPTVASIHPFSRLQGVSSPQGLVATQNEVFLSNFINSRLYTSGTCVNTIVNMDPAPKISFVNTISFDRYGICDVPIYNHLITTNNNFTTIKGFTSANLPFINNAILSPALGNVNRNIAFLHTDDCHLDPDQQRKLENNVENFVLYPNPNNGNFTIKYNIVNNGLLEIYDMNGRLMNTISLSKDKSEITTDNLNFNNGVYLYKISEKGKIYHQGKFIVAN